MNETEIMQELAFAYFAGKISKADEKKLFELTLSEFQTLKALLVLLRAVENAFSTKQSIEMVLPKFKRLHRYVRNDGILKNH